MDATQAQPLAAQQKQLFWADISTIVDINWIPADARLVPVRTWEWTIWFLVLVAIAIAGGVVADLVGWIWWSIIGIFFTCLYITVWFLIRKSCEATAYAFRDQDVLSRKGWLFQQTHVVPVHKIQHMVIKTGPIEKRYGLATLKLHTAAGSFTDIPVVGLTAEQAAQLKDWITHQNLRHDV
jgi:membrane protein YdbS with pleckstrin-like domain